MLKSKSLQDRHFSTFKFGQIGSFVRYRNVFKNSGYWAITDTEVCIGLVEL